MIAAKTEPGFDALAAELAVRARTLAEAATENAARARAGDPLRWRKAALLWPLFTKG